MIFVFVGTGLSSFPMFCFTKPSEEFIQRFIDAQRNLPFSYAEIGATKSSPPAGYTIDHNRICLGEGDAAFNAAVAALRSWKMFDLGWVTLCWPNVPIKVGATVAVLVRHFGFWSLHSARIVYLVDENSEGIRRFGFAYGTLPAHGERGEERFMIEWHRDDDRVWYDLLAFSQPNAFLARLGYSVSRMLQKRFAQASKQAMLKAVCEIVVGRRSPV
jgi:uncharacterized protein (UPF0548 family)